LDSSYVGRAEGIVAALPDPPGATPLGQWPRRDVTPVAEPNLIATPASSIIGHDLILWMIRPILYLEILITSTIIFTTSVYAYFLDVPVVMMLLAKSAPQQLCVQAEPLE